MLYNQPLATRFGTDLLTHLSTGIWKRLDIAVAWVRASGIAHLETELSSFLKGGNKLSIVVGIDLDNTTKEGLQALLDLGKHGNIEVFVHHNESGVIFHPKLYLFTNDAKAKLIVGSNNITEAGLYRNTEAGLEVDLAITDGTIVSVQNALKVWSDTSSGLAKKLDAALLAELVKEGYIQDETTATKALKSRAASAQKKRKKKLFGTVPVTAPALPAAKKTAKTAAGGTKTKGIKPVSPTSSTGSTLLMRVRKAHVTSRPTQTQIPKHVLNAGFFSGFTVVTSSHSGISHAIHEAKARGIVNTLKLEVPEMRTFADPVIRFERTSAGIIYETYDAASPSGATIMSALTAGRSLVPPATHLTLPKNPPRATWWRFI